MDRAAGSVALVTEALPVWHEIDEFLHQMQEHLEQSAELMDERPGGEKGWACQIAARIDTLRVLECRETGL